MSTVRLVKLVKTAQVARRKQHSTIQQSLQVKYPLLGQIRKLNGIAITFTAHRYLTKRVYM